MKVEPVCEVEGHTHVLVGRDQARARVVHCHEHGHYRNSVDAVQHLVSVHGHVHWHRSADELRQSHTHEHRSEGAFVKGVVLGAE